MMAFLCLNIYAQSVQICDLPGPFCATGDITLVKSEGYTISSANDKHILKITEVTGSHIQSSVIDNGSDGNSALITVNFKRADCAVRTTDITIKFEQTHTEKRKQKNKESIKIEGITIPRKFKKLGELDDITFSINSQNNYVFTTNAANATDWDWSVTGGTKEGPTNQRILEVKPSPGSCSISVTAEATGRCGTAAPKSTSVSIPNPSFIGGIAGPPSVGTNFGDYSSYSVYPGAAPIEYVWSVTGPFQLGSNGNSVIEVFVNNSVGYGSGNLYTYARTTCGQTSVTSKYITVGSGYPTGLRSQEVTEPVLISAQGEQKLLVPYPEDVEQVVVYDMSGRVVESLAPEGVEVPMSGLVTGEIYVVKTLRKSGETITTKTKITQ